MISGPEPRCGSCKFWRRRETRKDGAGHCVRIPVDGDALPRLEAPFDGGYGRADVDFLTPPDFGCVLHEPKGTE
jgi:hypothetical protein